MDQPGPAKDPDVIRSMFARIARRYDLNNRLHSLWRDQAWRRAAARMSQLRPGERALDVACGTGDLTAMLARRNGDFLLFPAANTAAASIPHDVSITDTSVEQQEKVECPLFAARVVGVDFCPEMLDIARRKFARLPIEWLQADAHSLPFADANFDVVTIAFGLRNLADPPRALREFMRVLRPGGRLVVLEFAPAGHGLGGRAIAWFVKHVMTRTASVIAGERGMGVPPMSGCGMGVPVAAATILPVSGSAKQQQQQQDASKMLAAREGGTPSTHAGKMPATQQDTGGTPVKRMGKMPMPQGGAYDYLHKSVQSFMSARQVAQELARAGLAQVHTREMAFGAVALCRGIKQ